MTDTNAIEKQIKVLEHKLNFWGKMAPALALLVGTGLGSIFTYMAKAEETSSSQNIRFAEIAISILAGEQSKNSRDGRLFAIRLLEEATKIEMGAQEFTIDANAWADKGVISPDRGILGGRNISDSDLQAAIRQERIECIDRGECSPQ
ncbi:MAG: hypothetical protein ABJ251_12385 [Paracoccaceae bacterium]